MKTLDISGFGAGYEQVCQTLLTRALKWASENEAVSQLKYAGYDGVFGLIQAQSEAAKSLDQAMFVGNIDATGAMHQSVVCHLLFILENGYDVWLAKGSDRQLDIEDPEREAALKKLSGTQL